MAQKLNRMPNSEQDVFPPLPLLATLLNRVGTESINYCVWKSNEHLEQALLGKTDLDLLVDPRHRPQFERCLEPLGLIRVEALAPDNLRLIHHYLGLDHTSGTLVHLHVHYRLVLGERHIKNHHLPLEDWLLRHRRLLAGVAVPKPQCELLILYVRAHLKITLRSLARSVLGGGKDVYPAPIRREFSWLIGQCDKTMLREAVESSALPFEPSGVTGFLECLEQAQTDPRVVLKHKRYVLQALRRYQRSPRIVARFVGAWRVVLASSHLRLDRRKRLPNQGIYVALVGADGSGKSTVVTDLATWLQRKLQVRSVYFGMPKSKLFPRLCAAFISFLSRLRTHCRSNSLRGFGRLLAGISALVDAGRWIYVARYRVVMHRRALRHRRKGRIVIAERFPMREFWHMQFPMDGPRLSSSQMGAGLLARVERHLYEKITPPDRIIVLHAPLEQLRERKPLTQPDAHKVKVDAVDSLLRNESYAAIDARLPYTDVLLRAKREVWSCL